MARRTASPGVVPRALASGGKSRKILFCKISWMTIAILSVVFTSTSGRAPVLSATMRFWIKADSLNLPPTLLTMASSFSSSCMIGPLEQLGHDRTQAGRRGLQVVVDHLIIVFIRPGQFSQGPLQAPFLDRGRFCSAFFQPFL